MKRVVCSMHPTGMFSCYDKKYELQGCHIGLLPVEVMLYILKWVVSKEFCILTQKFA